MATEKKQKLTVDCNPNIPKRLEGDEVRLKQIISNLLSNAVKYTPEGGSITVKIDFEVISLGSINLVISVIDNGIGIHDADNWRTSYGYRGSHGCVNVPLSAAKTMYDITGIGTKVIVHD